MSDLLIVHSRLCIAIRIAANAWVPCCFNAPLILGVEEDRLFVLGTFSTIRPIGLKCQPVTKWHNQHKQK